MRPQSLLKQALSRVRSERNSATPTTPSTPVLPVETGLSRSPGSVASSSGQDSALNDLSALRIRREKIVRQCRDALRLQAGEFQTISLAEAVQRVGDVSALVGDWDSYLSPMDESRLSPGVRTEVEGSALPDANVPSGAPEIDPVSTASEQQPPRKPTPARLPGTNSLQFVLNTIPVTTELALLAVLANAPAERWHVLSGRRLQMYGGTVHRDGLEAEPLPRWAQDLISIVEAQGISYPPYPSPSWPSQDSATPEARESKADPAGARYPRANHILVNEYKVGEGISGHTDGPAYSPQAVILSLGSPTSLLFWAGYAETRGGEASAHTSVHLPPRSLVAFSGALYSDALHGIMQLSEDTIYNTCANKTLLWPGQGEGDPTATSSERVPIRCVPRTGTRVSITIRYVRPRPPQPGPGPAVQSTTAGMGTSLLMGASHPPEADELS